MKKLSIIALALSILMLSGCASRNYKPDNGVGEPTGDVSTYLRGEHVSVEDARKRLESQGFEILANYESIREGTTIVFTSAALKREASKPMRAHIATMRMFIDNKENMISITNPVYFGKAFMQDDYNYRTFADIKAKITKVFPGLKHSADAIKYSDIDGYQIFLAEPGYEDFITITEGSNSSIISKLKAYKNGKMLLYSIELSSGATVVGYDINKKSKRFVKRYNRQNAAILPYEIVVDKNKATMLDGQYYLSVHYTQLALLYKSSRFSDSIEHDLKKPFN